MANEAAPGKDALAQLPSFDVPDLRPMLYRAVDQAGGLIAGVRPEHHGLAPPCNDIDVVTLVGHLLRAVKRAGATGPGEPPSGPSASADLPVDEWQAAFEESAAQVHSAWADDSLLDRTFRMPFGEFPGRVAVAALFEEITTHGWDLAAATGQLDRLDPELARVALGIAQAMVPAERRGGPMPFGPVVDVPANADPYSQLAGYLGRQP